MNAAERKLICFAAAVLDQSRNNGYPGEVCGGWLQDKAEALGVLVAVPVHAPCRDLETGDCPCAEYGFPTECYRLEAMVQATMAEAEQGEPRTVEIPK